MNEKDSLLLEELQQWEESIRNYEPTQFEETIDTWVEASFQYIPEELRDKFYNQLDTWLFHLHGLIQQSAFQKDAEKRIVETAKVFDKTITTIDDIRHLTLEQKAFIAKQQMAKHRLYALIQGGMTGTGKLSTLTVDIPAFATLNIRTTQLIAMSHGYKTDTPYEMVKLLQIFYAATLPKKYQFERWEQLKKEAGEDHDPYFYPLTEREHPSVWLTQPLTHLLKLIFIITVNSNRKGKTPIFGILTGAATNYHWTRKVSTFTNHYFYMKHFMVDEKDNW